MAAGRVKGMHRGAGDNDEGRRKVEQAGQMEVTVF